MRLPVRDADPLEPLHLGVEGLGGRPLRGKVHVARGEPAAACREGRTGEPFIDASMRELAATGPLSNRAPRRGELALAHRGHRVAMGAEWFESRLIAFDVGPNRGNWQYVASVGNDPRNPVFDVRAQASRYDGDGSCRACWGASTGA